MMPTHLDGTLEELYSNRAKSDRLWREKHANDVDKALPRLLSFIRAFPGHRWGYVLDALIEDNTMVSREDYLETHSFFSALEQAKVNKLVVVDESTSKERIYLTEDYPSKQVID